MITSDVAGLVKRHYQLSRLLEPQHYPEAEFGWVMRDGPVLVLLDSQGQVLSRYTALRPLRCARQCDPFLVLDEL